jgi:hypothetical protein
MFHHTKTKGDIAVGKVMSDLLIKGLVPYITFSEHQPFDLLAVGSDNKVFKVQVKYASLIGGKIQINRRSCWCDKNGLHIKSSVEHSIDLYAAYCPEKDIVLYVPSSIEAKSIITIRFSDTVNNQSKGVHLYSNFLNLPVAQLDRAADF